MDTRYRSRKRHLAMGTLHANNATRRSTASSISSAESQGAVADGPVAQYSRIVSQRLIPRGQQGRGGDRDPAHSPLISDLIFKGEVHETKEIMKKSRELGMQTFDQHLFDLYENGSVTYEDALRNADSVNELRLMIKLHGKEAKDKDLSTGIEHLNIV